LISNNISEILPGWTLTLDEVSNNVFKVTLTDAIGRQVTTTDSDLEKALITVQTYAFDIEIQISKNWTKFLYETSIIKLGDKKIIKKEYHEKVFGSWYIILTKNRILLDARDHLFSIQTFIENNWTDTKIFSLYDLTYEEYLNSITAAN
jgi:hypothetical protein